MYPHQYRVIRSGWVNTSNTGSGASASYQQATVPRTASMVPGYSTASVAGQQQIAAQGATIDTGDSIMTNNLQTLGTIRANQTSRQTDITNLETATQNTDASQQTVMATLQRINQALLLQLRTMQDANQINTGLALQQMVAQKQQQDADREEGPAEPPHGPLAPSLADDVRSLDGTCCFSVMVLIVLIGSFFSVPSVSRHQRSGPKRPGS